MKNLLRTCIGASGKLFGLLALTSLCYRGNAQVSSYSFAQSSGTFSALTGGTLIVANTDADPAGNDSASMDDFLYENRTLPFAFTFNGTSYNNYNICSNGWISFGTGTSLSPYQISETDYSGVIVGFGHDLMGPGTASATLTNGSTTLTAVTNTTTCQVGAKIRGTGIPAGTTVTAVTATTITMSAAATASSTNTYVGWTAGDIRTDVVGTAPNRTFVIQFRNMATYATAVTDGINEGITFQIRLSEGGGVPANQTVSVVYGNCFIDNNEAYDVQAGLRGLSPADINIRQGTTWAGTTAGADEFASIYFESGIIPASGLTFTWTPPAQCTGTPTAGTASSNVAAACPGNPFTLSATGATIASGISYQWQSSPPGGGNFTNISGATGTTYTAPGQAAATDYRLVVTCTNGATVTSANSNVVSVAQGGFYICYCQSNLGGFEDNAIDSVSIPSTTLNNSTPGTAPTYYTQYPASGSTTATLAKTVPYMLYTKLENDCIASVWIDYDHSGTFDAAEWTQITVSGTGVIATSITVPATALTGLTGMRIRSRADGNSNGATDACSSFGSGETEDYVITIINATACSGAPSGGTATATATSVCPNTPFNLNAQGYTAGVTGISYQWQSSPAGAGTFTNMSGATTVPYTVASQTAATDYRLVVTCANGSQSANSTTISVALNAPTDCYCVPSYLFFCDDGDDINTFTLTGAQSTSFNDLNTGCSVNAYDDRTAQTPVKMQPGSTYSGTISSNYGDDAVLDGTSERARFWIDFNDNGVFEAADSVGVKDTVLTSAVPYSITIPASATPGVHRMRVRLAYDVVSADLDPCVELDFGEVHDYKVEILCAPVAVALGNDTAICAGATLGLNAGNPGATYDWSNQATTQSISVTAAGTYSVTVTSAAGCIGKDTIVVSIAPLPVAGTLSATGSSPTFNFSTTGAQNVDTYSWNFGDGSSPAGGAQAGHTYTANGTYTVTLTVTNECGTATATTTVTVSGISVGTVPVSADDLKLFPNPSSGLVTISNVSALKMQHLTVTNTMGAVVMQKDNLDKAKDTIDVGNLAAGIYTVRIQTDKGVVVRQLQVSRH